MVLTFVDCSLQDIITVHMDLNLPQFSLEFLLVVVSEVRMDVTGSWVVATEAGLGRVHVCSVNGGDIARRFSPKRISRSIARAASL